MSRLIRLHILDKKGKMLSFYPISVTEENFFEISIVTGTYCENTSSVTFLSKYFNLTRFYAKISDFVLFLNVHTRVADIYERVQLYNIIVK